MAARFGLLAILGGITCVNLVVSRAPGSEGPMVASLLAVGDTLLSEVDYGCQVLVAFNSSCPFCNAAAQREREGDPLPTTWVGTTDDPGTGQYASAVHLRSRVIVSDSLYQMLRVQAVPVAFLLDGKMAVRRVWIYRGDEDAIDLRMRCMNGRNEVLS